MKNSLFLKQKWAILIIRMSLVLKNKEVFEKNMNFQNSIAKY